MTSRRARSPPQAPYVFRRTPSPTRAPPSHATIARPSPPASRPAITARGAAAASSRSASRSSRRSSFQTRESTSTSAATSASASRRRDSAPKRAPLRRMSRCGFTASELLRLKFRGRTTTGRPAPDVAGAARALIRPSLREGHLLPQSGRRRLASGLRDERRDDARGALYTCRARQGDRLAGLAAESATERVAAQMALADLPLAAFLQEPLIPCEEDEVTRLILDSHDSEAFEPVAST